MRQTTQMTHPPIAEPAPATWWARLLKTAPDSVVAQMGDGKRGGQIMALLNLFWLWWVVAVPWFLPLPPAAVVFTYASLAVFLPMYWRMWFGPRRELPMHLLGTTALGLISLPINSCWSYMIYAAAMLPFAYRPRAALPRLALLLLALMVVGWLSPRFNMSTLLFAASMCLIISLLNLQVRVNTDHSAELRLSHDEVRRLAAMAERERIGRDLHDLLGSSLSLIAIKSQLAGRLMNRDVDQARQEVADIEAVARKALGEVRSAVTGIRATALAAELASAKLLLEASGLSLHADVQTLPLTPETETALALGLREAVTNAQRHARASHIEVRLQAVDHHAVLTVQDNGRGGTFKPGNGLTGMTERLRALGGSLQVQAASPGTLLSLRLPLPPPLPVANPA
jgi:two-component system, NarL family, sensor histidine kinase DesK